MLGSRFGIQGWVFCVFSFRLLALGLGFRLARGMNHSIVMPRKPEAIMALVMSSPSPSSFPAATRTYYAMTWGLEGGLE